MRNKLICALLGVALLAGCREPDAPLGNGALFVSSDPQGGHIFLNGTDTGLLTPDTLHGLGGEQDVRVALELDGITYEYNARGLAVADEVSTLHGPLMARCNSAGTTSCNRLLSDHAGADLRFMTSATGALFAGRGGDNDGLVAPATGTDRYVAMGMPLFAARVGADPVANNIYDQVYAVGRPPLTRVQSGGTLQLTQSFWIAPPADHAARTTPRGIAVRERIIASDATAGVLLVELRYRNVSTDPLYRLIDGGAPEGGVTYQQAYIGLALDPDIGNANDDQASYDPALDAVYAYDEAFQEVNFSAENAPRLVGLRVLRAPAGTGVVLNVWERALDWEAGATTQNMGFGVLSGAPVFSPDHPGTQIGYLPESAHDTRIAAMAGPINLAPGDSATIVLAVAVAPPEPGTFVSGTPVAPGDPSSTTRPLHAIAATLRERLAAAEALLALLP